VPVLGPRRLQRGPGLEAIDVLQAALDHYRRHVVAARGDLLDEAVGPVSDVVGVGHVDARDALDAVDEAPPSPGIGGRAVRPGRHDLTHHLLALSHHHEVHEGGDRLGVGERADPTH
jgi:hypothetical protein